jgi:hypothetical protein
LWHQHRRLGLGRVMADRRSERRYPLEKMRAAGGADDDVEAVALRRRGLPGDAVEMVEAVDPGAEMLLQRRDHRDQCPVPFLGRPGAVRAVDRIGLDRLEEMRDGDEEAHKVLAGGDARA